MIRITFRNIERKSGDGDEDNTNSLSSEEAKQRTDKTEKVFGCFRFDMFHSAERVFFFKCSNLW